MKSTKPMVVVYAVAAALSLSTSLLGGPQYGGRQSEDSQSGGGQNGGNGGPQSSTTTARDPGVRSDAVTVGNPVSGIAGDQLEYFNEGLVRFMEVDSVSGSLPGEPGVGLGPGFNSNSCGNCHAQPGPGGSSPSLNDYPHIGSNPQIAVANADQGTNRIPFFVTPDGPVREARFPFMVSPSGALTQVPDGGVHDLFTIQGRNDALGCQMAQPNFAQMQQLGNLIFRIPTPVFGAGLIENIPDATILANMNTSAQLKQALGITGHPNYSGNDGTITRFGWKAQNKSLEIFAGEAYNVEQGVTNELFPDERGAPPSCMINKTPEDSTNFNQSGVQFPSDLVEFAAFMRFLAPPAPSAAGIPGNPSPRTIQQGQQAFLQAHCDLCHTPAMQTGSSALATGLSQQNAALYSDLLVHNMGSNLADNVSQGAAGADEFRTAPLWGVGQRIFFLHDGRATPANGGLLRAIEAHSGPGSEANGVISLFNNLTNQQQQDLLFFLRSL